MNKPTHTPELEARIKELGEILEKVVKDTKAWNKAVERIIGRQPETNIDLERAEAVLAKARGEK